MASSSPESSRRTPHAGALRVAATYAVLATAWIFGSDLALDWLLPERSSALWFNIAKGTGFVVLTSALLYRWTRREIDARDAYTGIFRHVVEEAPDLIFRYRLAPDPHFEYVSPATTAIVGYSPQEYYADPQLIMKLIHPEDRARLVALRENPPPDGQPIELRWVHRNGSTVWVEMRYRIAAGADGSPIVEGIARDITARREAESRKELLATAIEAAGEIVLITDPRGMIQYVNPAFTCVTGYTLEEVVGYTPRILKSGRHDARMYDDMWATLRAGRVFRSEFVNRRKDGTLYTQQATITPVRSNDGTIRNFVAVGRDVTGERRVEALLQHAQKHELIGRMASGVAHDFKNLLTVIQANADLASQAAERQPLHDIRRAAERGADMVRRLLALGRGGDVFEVVPGDLGALVNELGSTLRSILPAPVELSIRVQPAVPAVMMDRGAVEQIVLNLVTNARDAMPGGGHIELSVDIVRRNDATGQQIVRLCVCDTGSGIPTDLIDRIFEPFFTTHAEAGGSGLGLTMVRALCERQGAVLQVQSEPGKGTTMSILFSPAVASVVDPAGTLTTEPEIRPATGHERILIVDDEPALLRTAERAFHALGYTIETMPDGEQACRRLARDAAPFDLVITDLLMPGASGADVFRRARELGLNTRFLFVSGYGPNDPEAERLAPANAHFLEKPYTIPQLTAKARTVLDAHD